MPTLRKDQVNEVGGLAAEGWHLARVNDCKAKTSGKAEAYYNLAFETPAGDFLSYDIAMLEGKGNGIGIAKLLALGACEDIGDAYDYDLPAHIVGKECWIYLRHEEYDGKKRCKVDISEGRCGYLPLGSPPPGMNGAGASRDDSVDDDDDIPF